jgi:hypothetical protein
LADAIGLRRKSARNAAVIATASRESGSLIYTDKNTKARERHQTPTLKIDPIRVNFGPVIDLRIREFVLADGRYKYYTHDLTIWLHCRCFSLIPKRGAGKPKNLRAGNRERASLFSTLRASLRAESWQSTR